MLSTVRFQITRLHKHQNIRVLINNFCDNVKDDKESKKPEITAKKENDPKLSSMSRLNQLLASMSRDEDTVLLKKIQVAKPGKKKQKKVESDSDSDDEKPANIAKATAKVARTLGGDVKKTESELLAKLLKLDNSGESVNKVIETMQIDQAKAEKSTTQQEMRAEFRQNTGTHRSGGPREPSQRKSYTKSTNLFDGRKLNIFQDVSLLEDKPDMLETWSRLTERELRISVARPPKNYFEKMALWTNQGKVWKFPIDNEQGRDEEANVYFTDHIFLDQHLEGWCPSSGPVRHFMELVCVGLSKNHYLTVQEKIDHIMWFKDYFEQKKDLLKELIMDEASTEKQLEK